MRNVELSGVPRLVSSACLVIALAVAGSGLAAPEDAHSFSQPDRVILANEILNRWEPIAEQAGAHPSAWREIFATQLAGMDISILHGIDRVKIDATRTAEGNYTRFAQVVRGAEMQSYATTHANREATKLASTTTDQVFIPIVPCRIVDTRNTAARISAGSTANFYFVNIPGGNWMTQGGIAGVASSVCPGTVSVSPAPSAAVVTVTVVNPTSAGNWIVWGGANPVPTISALNWTDTGQVLANTTVIPNGGRTGTGPGGNILDFAVKYNGPSGSADFVADVVGYLVENQHTALDCLGTAVNSATAVTGQATMVVGDACPTGYALTGGLCNLSGTVQDGVDDGHLAAQYYVGALPQAGWGCIYYSNSSLITSIKANSICCRVPGR